MFVLHDCRMAICLVGTLARITYTTAISALEKAGYWTSALTMIARSVDTPLTPELLETHCTIHQIVLCQLPPTISQTLTLGF